MLRIICKHDDAGMAANVGGSVLSTFKTFEIQAPEIETWLKVPERSMSHAQVIGVEIVTEDAVAATPDASAQMRGRA